MSIQVQNTNLISNYSINRHQNKKGMVQKQVSFKSLSMDRILKNIKYKPSQKIQDKFESLPVCDPLRLIKACATIVAENIKGKGAKKEFFDEFENMLSNVFGNLYKRSDKPFMFGKILTPDPELTVLKIPQINGRKVNTISGKTKIADEISYICHDKLIKDGTDLDFPNFKLTVVDHPDGYVVMDIEKNLKGKISDYAKLSEVSKYIDYDSVLIEDGLEGYALDTGFIKGFLNLDLKTRIGDALVRLREFVENSELIHDLYSIEKAYETGLETPSGMIINDAKELITNVGSKIKNSTLYKKLCG